MRKTEYRKLYFQQINKQTSGCACYGVIVLVLSALWIRNRGSRIMFTYTRMYACTYIYVPMYIHTCIHILNYILIRQCGFHFYNEFSDCIKIEHKELVKTLKLKKQECVTFVVLFYFILLLLTLKFLYR